MSRKKTAASRIENLLCALQREGIAVCVAAGLVLSLCTFFEVSHTVGILVLASAVGVLLSEICGGKRMIASFGLLILFLVLVTAGRELFLNGMLFLYNEGVETIGRRDGIWWSGYTLLSETSAEQDAEIFLGMLCLLVGFFCHQLVCGRRKTAACTSLLATVFFLYLNQAGTVGWRLLIAGTMAWFLYLSYHNRRQKSVRTSGVMVFCAWLLALICAFGTVGVGTFCFPKEKYEEPELVKNIRTEVLNLTDQLRYKKKKVNTLPKGNLTLADTWETTEETALRVTMSEPESLYLRGYVGSVYEGDCWQPLTSEVYYENQALFYWLNEWGMSGNTQLSALRGKLEDSDLEEGETILSIENVNADSEYIYIPYEWKGFEKTTELVNGAGESALRSRKFMGSRSYSYRSAKNLVKDFPQAAALSYLYRKENPTEQYTEAESYYNVFVYENYTKLPSGVQTLLSKELGYAGEAEEEHADYRSVITKIRNYLDKNVTYGAYAEKLPQGDDFLSFFLTEGKIGNAVHYATAATLMFRYYGIPARYAEGYLITPEDVVGTERDCVIELSGERGHAWTEIYVDGLGWVPIEMTPEYYDVMEQPDLTKGLQTDSAVVIRPPQEMEQEQEEKSSEALKEHLSQIFLNVGKWILWLLIGFDFLCLLVFFYLCLRRMIANLRRSRRFHSKDRRLSIRSMAGYIERIVQVMNGELSEEAEKYYRNAQRIGQKAAFSLHKMSVEEQKAVAESRKYLLKMMKKKKGWYDKWILKYIERLY